MQRIATVEALRAALDAARKGGARVGVVPTMGAIHDGHLGLVAKAKERADFVTLTVFVNPTQFGPGEDLDSYPRTLDADCAAAERAGCDLVFSPPVSAMYPSGEQTRVRLVELARHLCGPSRPVHFEGVATVVTKLFALFAPCTAVFGRKDYQQLAIIRRLATDLLFDVEVVGARTVRESDGLAMSSRNRYLTPAQRDAAVAVPRALSDAWRAFEAGERSARVLRELVRAPLAAAADGIDYVEIADPDELVPLGEDAVVGTRCLIAVAAKFGQGRLIDNVVLGEDPAPLP